MFNDKNIISLVGLQGSGKSTLGKALASLYSTTQIEVSSVVKSIHQDLDRDSLPSTSSKTKDDPYWLGRYLGEILNEYFSCRPDKTTVIVTGVREPQVHTFFTAKGLQVYTFEIIASHILRYNRVKELGKVSSEEQFLNHELDEINMGVLELMDGAPYQVTTSEDTSPKRLAFAIKDKLTSVGII